MLASALSNIRPTKRTLAFAAIVVAAALLVVGRGGSEPLLDAGFENGFEGWSTAGVGDVEPTIATDRVRSGSHAAKFELTGSQGRSELILSGEGEDGEPDAVEFREGVERFYGFSFLVRSMVYGRPGAHNLIMQLKSDGSESPNVGLMLWDHDGERGLWTHGEAMGGDRFLRPISHDRWHDVVVHFKASRTGDGFYRLYLDDELVDTRDDVSIIRPDRTHAYIKQGLYRNGAALSGTSEIRLDAVRLGTGLDQVGPD